MTDFNKLYKVHKNPWGSKPIPEIVRFADQFKPGSILDVGIGDGRNALFLAERGFRLTGLDISEDAIEIFQQKAKELNVTVSGIVADIGAVALTQTYDNIISHYTLHFLSKAVFPKVIAMIQEQTAVGGINMLTDFTQDGPLYRPDTTKYWLKSNELQHLYQDWEVVSYEEKPVRTRATDDQGRPYTQTAATIVARKSL